MRKFSHGYVNSSRINFSSIEINNELKLVLSLCKFCDEPMVRASPDALTTATYKPGWWKVTESGWFGPERRQDEVVEVSRGHSRFSRPNRRPEHEVDLSLWMCGDTAHEPYDSQSAAMGGHKG
jgi:hypothetical protein